VFRQQQQADMFRSLENWHSVFRGRLEQGMRHGLTKAIRESIDDAAAQCGTCITKIMQSMPAPMLTKNRY